jgi:hypothetical protein
MVASVIVRHNNDGWSLQFSDEAVWQISFDYGVSIITEHVVLRIEKSFEVDFSGRVVPIEPGSPVNASDVVALHQLPLAAAKIQESGALIVNFADGVTLSVAPADDPYEAFTFDVDGGWKFVSMPGGGLTWWLPEGVDGDVVELHFTLEVEP